MAKSHNKTCRFCGIQLPERAARENRPYCSKKCYLADTSGGHTIIPELVSYEYPALRKLMQKSSNVLSAGIASNEELEKAAELHRRLSQLL